MKRLAPVLLLSAALAAACAQQPAQPASMASSANQCFFAGTVNSFKPSGDHSVDVRVGATKYYRLDLTGACPDVDWAQGVALRTLGGGTSICQGLDAEIIVPSPSGPQRCFVSGVRRLSDAEAQGLRYH
jgi:hypothetical protein